MGATPHLAATIVAVVGTGLAVSGCAQGSPAGSPSVRGVPLAAGSRIVAQVRRCNPGANSFCALELVLVAPRHRYSGSAALLAGEARRLRRAGWGTAHGDTSHESAAESRGHRLRLIYATGSEDLQSIDLGTIMRAPAVARTLSTQMFARTPALSLMLQTGSS